MPHPTTLAAALTAALAALPAAQAGMYTKSSPVLQVDARSYSKLIAKSNHTSVRGQLGPLSALSVCRAA